MSLEMVCASLSVGRWACACHSHTLRTAPGHKALTQTGGRELVDTSNRSYSLGNRAGPCVLLRSPRVGSFDG